MLAQFTSDTVEATPRRLFYSYSHKDRTLRNSLSDHLQVLKRQGFLDSWHDRQILPGENWKKQIDQHLESAEIILLLISASFIASEYCYDVEMKRALEKHEAKSAIVIPVILRPVFWQILPFAKLQALPDNGKPVIAWRHKDEAFANITEQLRQVIFRFRSLTTLTVSPRASWHWIIKFSESFPLSTEASALLTLLRVLSQDDAASIAAMSEQKGILIIEGSEQGFEKLNALHRSNALSAALGNSVADFYLAHGATTRAKATLLDKEPSEPGQFTNYGAMVSRSNKYCPFISKGLYVPKESLETYQFVFDTGDEGEDSKHAVETGSIIATYFLTSLAVEADDLWCNLSAYESNRMVPEVLAETQLGRDMLAQDVVLKKLTASLLHPDNPVGKEYWEKLFAKTQEICSTEASEITTFQKVWIKAKDAQVYQTALPTKFEADAPAFLQGFASMTGNVAFITQSTMGVFCEEDEFAIQANIAENRNKKSSFTGAEQARINGLAIDIFKEYILPVIEEEVNECFNFRLLRQIYAACILAKWFKEEFRGRSGYDSIVGTGAPRTFNVRGLPTLLSVRPGCSAPNLNKGAAANKYQDMSIPINREYYSEYMKLFKEGVFDVVRATEGSQDRPKAFRRYFSGAIDFSWICWKGR